MILLDTKERALKRVLANPEKHLMAEFGNEIASNAKRKYKRDGATCDFQKYLALYWSACVRDIKRNPHRYK